MIEEITVIEYDVPPAKPRWVIKEFCTIGTNDSKAYITCDINEVECVKEKWKMILK